MSDVKTVKIDQPSEPGEYDAGMLTLLQIIWGEGARARMICSVCCWTPRTRPVC